MAEGSNALASDISLEAEESQLVLEVSRVRSAGWPWSDVISILADGIAVGPEGELTQLLEISTADHTFRFLAPAYKVGMWVSALPGAGRDCWRALKDSSRADDTVEEDDSAPEVDSVFDGEQPRELVSAFRAGFGPSGVAERAENEVDGPTISEIAGSGIEHLEGDGRMEEEEWAIPWDVADGAAAGHPVAPPLWIAPESAIAPDTPNAPRPVRPLTTPRTPVSPGGDSRYGAPSAPDAAGAAGATGATGATGAPGAPGAVGEPVANAGAGTTAESGTAAPAGPGTASGFGTGITTTGAAAGATGAAVGRSDQTQESGESPNVRGKRHAKRRLFGRSARSDNRLFSSHPRPDRPRPVHAQPLSTAEVIRNLLTWRKPTIVARPTGKHSMSAKSSGLAKNSGLAKDSGISNAGDIDTSDNAGSINSAGDIDTPGTTKAGATDNTGASDNTGATDKDASTSTEGTKRVRKPSRRFNLSRRYATLGLAVLIAGITAASTAAAFQTGATSKTKARHVVGPVAPDWPQTHGLIDALAPTPKHGFNLVRAKSKPKPALASLLSAPSLQSHEIFAFAPYWTLPTESSFNVADMTTLSYFGLDVNANGSIVESGDGWTGYESQDLTDLISRAHAAGDRVVLTAECFNQATLNAVTNNPAAATTLGNELVNLVEAKNLDGINIDFEGAGPADQQGLDRMMARVSSIVRHADSHWQVTMDTYASSAGDANGFYDIAGLAPSVNAFFVMAYQMGGPTGSAKPQFSGSDFSAGETLNEYSQVVPLSKVILGLPYYGYNWPTNGPSASASPTGPATPVADAKIVTAGKSVYWNQASGTAWIAYKTGKQWYQTWFEDATALSLKAQLATSSGARGIGIWALGMEGNDPALLAALVGNAPIVKDYAPSPADASTTTSASTTSTTRASTTTTTGATSTTSTSTSTSTGASTTTTTTGSTTTTTTTDPSTTTTTESTTTTSTTDPGSTTTTSVTTTTTTF